MANFGPPTIVFGFQTVTFVPGNYADFFQPEQEVIVLDASRRGMPIEGGLATTYPPNVFVQVDD